MSSIAVIPESPWATQLGGQSFGRLSAVARVGTAKNGSAMWLCKCSCGESVRVRSDHLKSGHTQSCGCIDNRVGGCTTHGGSPAGRRERLYHVWLSMRQRCHNPQHAGYMYYGARGIAVCAEWDDYAVFREWANQSGYDPDAPRGTCTLDRTDNDGDYSPGNCRWVDMTVQANNRRPRRARVCDAE